MLSTHARRFASPCHCTGWSQVIRHRKTPCGVALTRAHPPRRRPHPQGAPRVHAAEVGREAPRLRGRARRAGDVPDLGPPPRRGPSHAGQVVIIRAERCFCSCGCAFSSWATQPSWNRPVRADSRRNASFFCVVRHAKARGWRMRFSAGRFLHAVFQIGLGAGITSCSLANKTVFGHKCACAGAIGRTTQRLGD